MEVSSPAPHFLQMKGQSLQCVAYCPNLEGSYSPSVSSTSSPSQPPQKEVGNRLDWNYPSKVEPQPQPWHFPGLEGSTHHLFLHTRLTGKSPTSWEEMSTVDTTLSMQFVVQGDFDWLKIGPLIPGYEAPNQSLLPISQEEKAANLVAGQIGFYLADRWMPTIQEQWLVERYLDPISRKKGSRLKLLPEEKKAERLRIADWTGRMDYCYTKLIERYQNIIERTPERLSQGE